jgi:NADH-quinone oxidoreductase subunit N
VFVGFVTKFYLFTAAAAGGLLWLVLLATVNSLISLYYYLMVIKQAYLGTTVPVSDQAHATLPVPAEGPDAHGAALPAIRGASTDEPPNEAWRVSPVLQGLSLILFVAMVALGVYPGPLVAVIEAVGRGLFGG